MKKQAIKLINQSYKWFFGPFSIINKLATYVLSPEVTLGNVIFSYSPTNPINNGNLYYFEFVSNLRYN